MKIELHIIQNFAPSCLNRDDTNAPKDCEFGGFRRARISSQCLKRSIRTHSIFKEELTENLAKRTKLLIKVLSDLLIAAGVDENEITPVVPLFVQQYVGLEKDNRRTKVLLYLGNDELNRMAGKLKENWSTLLPAAQAVQEEEKKNKRDKNKALEIFKDLAKTVSREAVGATKAVDIALFGRMVAESPTENIDAACQVAHALSTHKVSMEMDFFTAVDDISNESGAGMMGTVEFNSACFYRYSLVDLEQLVQNLQGDRELALSAIKTFLAASVAAIPSGKQTSMAAQNPPSFVMVVVRESGVPCSLANAFEKPVLPSLGEGENLVAQSIKRLDDYWGRVNKMYGNKGIKARPVCLLDDVSLKHLNDQQVDNTEQLFSQVQEALS